METAPAMTWQARFDLAETLFAEGAAAQAEAAYTQVITAAPKHLPAYIGASRCARRRGDRAASLAYYDAAAEMHPTHIGVQMERAADLRALNRLDEAEAVYRSVIGFAPGNMQARLGLGTLARQRGDRAAAMAVFQAAAESAPDNPWPLIEVAAEYRALNQWDEAEATYTSVLLIARDNAQAWLGLGHCARRRGNRHISFAIFHAGSLAAPNDPWPLLEAAVDLRELNRIAEAETLYAQALEKAPETVQGHLGLGHCARKRGDRELAMTHVRAAMRVAPAEPWPLLDLSADLRELGRLDEAEAAARQALDLAPRNAQPYISLGACARKRGDRQASMAIYRAAIEAIPNDPWLRVELAADLRDLQQFSDAEAMYREALRVTPGNVQALLGLGFCARARGDRAAALARFEEAATANPHDASPLLEIAVEQREAGGPDAAIATAEQVLARHAGNFHAMLSIGQSARYAGRHEAALAAFRRAHEANPGHAEPLVEMAVSARALGRQAECDALLARALDKDPRNVTVIVRLAEQAAMAQDHATVLALYEQGAAEQPGQLQFHLGAANARAALGQMAAAQDALAALRKERGPLPAILGQSISLLRQAGDYPAALKLARESAAAAPENMQLWSELFHTEMLAGTDADVAACLAAAPAGTARQEAALRRHQAQFAESCWRFDSALADYEAAAAANPHDAGLQQDLTRMKTLFLDLEGARGHLRRFCELTAHETRLRKKSLNISQTQYGQILDEYRLDTEVVAAVKPLLGGPVAGIAEIVRENPDSTAAAVSLMIALRCAGAFDAPAAGAGGIPNVLVQYWDTEEPPADVAGLMRTWGAQNPGLNCVVFNDQTAQAFLAKHFPPQVLYAYRRGEYATQKSDIFRLAYLAVAGGIYADADDRCLGQVERILPAAAQLVVYQDDHMTLCNNFIAAAPRHPVLMAALKGAVVAMLRGDRDTVWFSTGPALLTRAFTAVVVEAGGVPAGTVVHSRRGLAQAVAIHCGAAYKKTEKHWLNAMFGGVGKGRRAE
jgi:tetratricopeptide (TPR) repeat protein